MNPTPPSSPPDRGHGLVGVKVVRPRPLLCRGLRALHLDPSHGRDRLGSYEEDGGSAAGKPQPTESPSNPAHLNARARLRYLFPYLPQQPGYNKRLRACAQLVVYVIRALAADTTLWTDDVWVVDSTPVECGRSRETAKRSELVGWAEYGYCASHSRYFWGLRLHLLCTLGGLPVGFALTGAKADERQALLGIFANDPDLVANRPGQTLIGDKNYYGRDLTRLGPHEQRAQRGQQQQETALPGRDVYSRHVDHREALKR